MAMWISVRTFTPTLSCLGELRCSQASMGHDQGVDSLGTLDDEDQGGCTSREEVLSVDRRKHPLFPVNFPADVDFQGRIRRVGTPHCPPQVLLNALASTKAMLYGWMIPPRNMA